MIPNCKVESNSLGNFGRENHQAFYATDMICFSLDLASKIMAKKESK